MQRHKKASWFFQKKIMEETKEFGCIMGGSTVLASGADLGSPLCIGMPIHLVSGSEGLWVPGVRHCVLFFRPQWPINEKCQLWLGMFNGEETRGDIGLGLSALIMGTGMFPDGVSFGCVLLPLALACDIYLGTKNEMFPSFPLPVRDNRGAKRSEDCRTGVKSTVVQLGDAVAEEFDSWSVSIFQNGGCTRTCQVGLGYFDRSDRKFWTKFCIFLFDQ